MCIYFDDWRYDWSGSLMTWENVTGISDGVYLDLMLAGGRTTAIILATSLSLLLLNQIDS